MSAKAKYSFFKVPNAAFEVGLSGSSFHVFIFLIRRANGNSQGRCWPGLRDIQKNTNIGSRSTVVGAIRLLVDRGFVSLVGRTDKGCHIYQIHFDALESAARDFKPKGSENEDVDQPHRNTGFPQRSSGGGPLFDGDSVQLLDKGGPLSGHEVITMKKNQVKKEKDYMGETRKNRLSPARPLTRKNELERTTSVEGVEDCDYPEVLNG